MNRIPFLVSHGEALVELSEFVNRGESDSRMKGRESSILEEQNNGFSNDHEERLAYFERLADSQVRKCPFSNFPSTVNNRVQRYHPISQEVEV